MTKKGKKILISVLAIIIIGISVAAFKLISDGFNFLTYATENNVEKQLEEILSRESDNNKTISVENIGFKEYGENYLGFFDVTESETDELVIVKYSKVAKLGQNNVLNFSRIIKGDNSVVMMDIADNEEKQYIIFSGVDSKEYTGLNIFDKDDNELLLEIDLKKKDQTIKEEKIAEKYSLFTYETKNNEDIRLELVQKSGE